MKYSLFIWILPARVNSALPSFARVLGVPDHCPSCRRRRAPRSHESPDPLPYLGPFVVELPVGAEGGVALFMQLFAIP